VRAKVVRIGNSQGVRLPKAALQQARLSAGQRVRLAVVEDTIGDPARTRGPQRLGGSIRQGRNVGQRRLMARACRTVKPGRSEVAARNTFPRRGQTTGSHWIQPWLAK